MLATQKSLKMFGHLKILVTTFGQFGANLGIFETHIGVFKAKFVGGN